MCHDVRIPIPIPWCPTLPHAYLHTYMYVSLCMCVMMCVLILWPLSLLCSLSCCLCLSYSSLSSSSLALSPCLGKACPWAEAAGLFLSTYTSFLFYLFIIQEYTCIVCIHTSLYTRQYMCMYYSLCMYPTDVCMCIVYSVLYCVHAALCIHGSIHAVLYSIDYLCIVYPVCIACVYNIHAVYSVLFIL